MKDLVLDILILKVVAPLSVALVVFAQGLGISPRLVVTYFQERPGLMLRALVAALILVPTAALGLILALEPSPGVAVGLAILVSCPPAPLMIFRAPRRGGANAAFMASLHLSLAALALLTVPAVLYLLSIPLAFKAEVGLSVLAWILASTILVPIGLGLIVRAFLPTWADRFGPMVGKVGNVGVLVVLLFVLVVFYPALRNMDRWSYLVIAAVSALSLAIGHLLGPRDAQERTTLAVECGVRHPALAFTIASANFSPEKALPVMAPCVITFVVIATVYMTWRGRGLVTAKPASTAGVR